jgi:hypothetical protein
MLGAPPPASYGGWGRGGFRGQPALDVQRLEQDDRWRRRMYAQDGFAQKHVGKGPVTAQLFPAYVRDNTTSRPSRRSSTRSWRPSGRSYGICSSSSTKTARARRCTPTRPPIDGASSSTSPSPTCLVTRDPVGASHPRHWQGHAGRVGGGAEQRQRLRHVRRGPLQGRLRHGGFRAHRHRPPGGADHVLRLDHQSRLPLRTDIRGPGPIIAVLRRCCSGTTTDAAMCDKRASAFGAVRDPADLGAPRRA